VAFGFTRAYTKQMQKSRSDDSAKQRAFVSKRKETKRRRRRHLVSPERIRNKCRSHEVTALRSILTSAFILGVNHGPETGKTI